MNFRKLIQVYPELPKLKYNQEGIPIPFGESSGSSSGVGVFVTSQSFVTFPVASGAINIIYLVLGKVFPSLSGNNVVILIIAFIIGAFIYFFSINNEMDNRKKIEALILAIVNSFFLAASALGVTTAISPPNQT